MSSAALRHVRHLSTTVVAAAQPVSISYIKRKLKNIQNPDEALKLYANFTSTYLQSSTPALSIRYAQEFTVRLLAKSNRFSDIESLLESHKIQPQITDEAFLSSLIRSYGVAGMFENALKTYEQMEELGTPRSSISFNSLLIACADSKVFERVPNYFKEFPVKYGFLPDKFSYGILIKFYCKMNSPDVAIEKVSEMEAEGVQIDAVVLNTILHHLYENGKRYEAAKFWDDMVIKKGMKPDLICYNVRLAHVVDNNPGEAKSLIDEMKNVGIQPDIISYNHLLGCYCRKGMMDEAKSVYDELFVLEGCNPSDATFTTLMYSMSKNGKYLTSFQVFNDSVKRNKIPNFRVLSYLLKGLVKNGYESEAKSMVHIMNKRFKSALLRDWEKLADDLGVLACDDLESNN